MPKQKKRKSKSKHPVARRYGPRVPSESQPAEVLTVAWTVSVTAVLLCDFAAVASHMGYVVAPDLEQLRLLENLLLFSGSVIGLVSIGLLGVILRIRQVAPPTGFIAFSILVSAAPLLTILGRSLF